MSPPTSATIHRHATLETIAVEPFDGMDGQGKPTYAASVNVEAFVQETDEVLPGANGTDVRIELKAWVPGTESTLPGRRDRVTRDGVTHVVELEKPVDNFRGELDHVKLMMREE